jgi:hypothetical protein
MISARCRVQHHQYYGQPDILGAAWTVAIGVFALQASKHAGLPIFGGKMPPKMSCDFA